MWAVALSTFLIALAPGELGSQNQASIDSGFLEAYRQAEPLTKWPLEKLRHEIPELKGLDPAPDQSELPRTLAEVAENLKTFWKNFQNTSSLETIQESRQLTSSLMSVVDRAVQQFRYLMLTDPDSALQIKEYRTDLHGRELKSEPAVSGFVRTSGFTSLPFVFGPGEQPLTDYRDLGSQVLHGRLCRVLAFAQHVDPAAASHWSLAGQQVPILIQGVAWINAAGGQVVQMRTDLLAPQPRVELHRATTIVTFAPVKFHSSSATFWLPQEVTVSIDLDKYTFVNRQYYSDYQVFTVSTSKIEAPILPDGLGSDAFGPDFTTE